ncbi:MAG: hypothetical protein E6J87_24665 [Deltaproteobacteria bacterium]|nr:MAG: hypothetical protein E6J87_24665 [Deltaproteobacteria bacterium]
MEQQVDARSDDVRARLQTRDDVVDCTGRARVGGRGVHDGVGAQRERGARVADGAHAGRRAACELAGVAPDLVAIRTHDLTNLTVVFSIC